MTVLARPWLYDRTRVTTDWRCPRARFWGYEYEGRGLAKGTMSLELFIGITIHDTFSLVAKLTAEKQVVDIDTIARAAYDQMFAQLTQATAGQEDSRTFASEQGTLVEGIVRGYYRHVWPRLLATYPAILCVEEEMIYDHDHNGKPIAADNVDDMTLRFMSKPDFVLANEKEVVYVEYKSTKSKKEDWITSWDTAIQLHSTVRAVKATKGVDVDAVIVQGLYKGYESWGKQSSPFCLAPTTNVLTNSLEWKQIGDIQEGDELVGFDEFSSPERHWRKSVVEKIGRFTLPCQRITLSNGQQIICSQDHMWLTGQNGTGLNSTTTKWVSSDKLRPLNRFGLRSSRIVKLLDVWETDTSFDGGYASGLLDGEGFVAHVNPKRDFRYVTVGFAQKPGTIMNWMKQYLTANGVTAYGPYSPYGPRSATSLQINNRADVLRVLGITRAQRLLQKFDVNKLGLLRTKHDPLIVVSVENIGEREVVTIQTSTRTFVAEGLASHNCYAYHKRGNPPFTKEEWSYDYKAGLKRVPTWEMEGGVKQWVENMPENILADQFPQTAPIYINDDQLNAFFEQRGAREAEIRDFRSYPAALQAKMLPMVFPQKFDACQPAYGSKCDFRLLCHSYVADPLKAGFSWREPHHTPETEAMGL